MKPDASPPVALVTGAGRGVGADVSRLLASNGYRVALTARSSDQLHQTAQSCDGETLVIAGDITSVGFVEALFDEIEQTWAPVEALVVNAGAGSSAPLASTTDEDWQQVLDLNLTAPFRCIRRAIPHMIEAKYGRVVAIGSTASKIGEPYIAAYTASKHGLLGLVRSAAAEVARHGVTVNAICPGYIDSPMTDQTVASIAEKTGRDPAQARTILERKQPHGKLIDPTEVAAAVWMCISNGAINGQGINVDGGTVQS